MHTSFLRPDLKSPKLTNCSQLSHSSDHSKNLYIWEVSFANGERKEQKVVLVSEGLLPLPKWQKCGLSG